MVTRGIGGGADSLPDQKDEMDYSEEALERDLAALRQRDSLPALDMERLFAGVAAVTVDRRAGLRDKLRELSTPVRIALALLGALVMIAVALLTMGIRTDLTGQAIVRYAIAMTAIAGLMGVVFTLSLRGMHRRPVGRLAWGVILVALTLPLVLALTPAIWATPRPAVMGAEGMSHLPCLMLGLVTGGLTAAVCWVFQRQDWQVLWRLAAAAAGGGLTAFAMLQLHCPSTDPTHLLIGHAGVGLLLTAVVAVLVSLRRS